jgi:hypothetical protein
VGIAIAQAETGVKQNLTLKNQSWSWRNRIPHGQPHSQVAVAAETEEAAASQRKLEGKDGRKQRSRPNQVF